MQRRCVKEDFNANCDSKRFSIYVDFCKDFPEQLDLLFVFLFLFEFLIIDDFVYKFLRVLLDNARAASKEFNLVFPPVRSGASVIVAIVTPIISTIATPAASVCTIAIVTISSSTSVSAAAAVVAVRSIPSASTTSC